MAAAETPGRARTYGNWRRPASAGILGLGTIGTAILLGGIIVVVFISMVKGLGAAMIALVILGVSLVLLLNKDVHGKNVFTRVSNRLSFSRAKAAGSNLYRSGPLGRVSWGTYQLPGVAAPIRLSEYQDSYERPFAVLHTPATSSFSVVIASEPDGASLVDPEQVDAWVANWGAWLASLGDEPGIEAAAVVIETAPDTGSRLRQEVALSLDPDAPPFSRAVLNDLVESYPHGSSTVEAYITLTFSAATRKGGRKRVAEEMGLELASRLPGLTGSLESTGAGAARPVSAQELCELIRVAYDPAVAPLLAEAHSQGEVPDLSWADVGPAAHEASWDGYRHDSAYSRTWAMTSAPRGNVQSGVLTRLLAPNFAVTRKRVALLYRPIDPARAAGIVEADMRNATFRANADGGPMKARDAQVLAASSATAREEATGAGLVEFGLVVTATVTDRSQWADATAAIDNLAASARLRLRPQYGSQDSAFASALPLGLVIPKHIKVPTSLREKL